MPESDSHISHLDFLHNRPFLHINHQPACTISQPVPLHSLVTCHSQRVRPPNQPTTRRLRQPIASQLRHCTTTFYTEEPLCKSIVTPPPQSSSSLLYQVEGRSYNTHFTYHSNTPRRPKSSCLRHPPPPQTTAAACLPALFLIPQARRLLYSPKSYKLYALPERPRRALPDLPLCSDS